MEKILKFEETTDKFDGYRVHTTEQIIELAIDNNQSCCESWGYFMSEDNLEAFVGAELLGIKITDVARNTAKVQKEASNLDYGGIMFVDLETDRGVLQFVCYNSHNGYYGHTASVKSNQITYEVGV